MFPLISFLEGVFFGFLFGPGGFLPFGGAGAGAGSGYKVIIARIGFSLGLLVPQILRSSVSSVWATAEGSDSVT